MEEVEKKEKEDEAGVKPSKEKGGKGKFGKLKIAAVETMPSPVGRRVQPKVNEDDRKKLEKLDQAARNAKDGIKKEKKGKVREIYPLGSPLCINMAVTEGSDSGGKILNLALSNF